MTDKDKMILEQYVSEDAFDIPDMAPTSADLKNPIPILKEIPMKAKPVLKAESWDTFWNTGIITLINGMITSFGFGLVAQRDGEGKVTNVYPIRTNNRGLNEQSTIDGLALFSRFLAENAKTLNDESYVADENLRNAIAAAQEEEVKRQQELAEAQKASDNGDDLPDVRPQKELKNGVNRKTRSILKEAFAAKGIDLDAVKVPTDSVLDIPDTKNPPTATVETDMIVEGEMLTDDSDVIECDDLPEE